MTEKQLHIGRRIRELRRLKAWSQKELAREAELHHTLIGRVERGEEQVGLENLTRIAEALGHTVDDIMKVF